MDLNINEFLLSFKLVMHWTMFLATVVKWNNKDNNTYHPDCVSIAENTDHLAVQVTRLKIPIPSSGFCLALDYWPQLLLFPAPASAWVLHVDFHFLVRHSSGSLSSSPSFIPGSEWAFLCTLAVALAVLRCSSSSACTPTLPSSGSPELSPPRPPCAAVTWHQGPVAASCETCQLHTLRFDSEKQKVTVISTNQTKVLFENMNNSSTTIIGNPHFPRTDPDLS